jgi:hypothetical protein
MPDPGANNPEPQDKISLEEWIASCQSCCGVEPESWREAPEATPQIAGDDVQSKEPPPSP